MKFDLVDRVLELGEDRIVTVKMVTNAEEYLRDHFPGFPVLPGVLMLEAMVQAGRRLLESRDPGCSRHVLGGVRALKYGSFARPGMGLRVRVELVKDAGDGVYELKGVAESIGSEDGEGGQTCASGKFTMRGVRVD